jgi:hypothetical protein
MSQVVVSSHFLIQGTGHFVVPTLDISGSQVPPFNACLVTSDDCNKYPDGSQVVVSVQSFIQGTGHFVVPTLDGAGSPSAPTCRSQAPPFIDGLIVLEDCNKNPEGSQVDVSAHSFMQGTGHFVGPTFDTVGSQAPPFSAGCVILEDCNKYPDGSQIAVSVHSLTH